MNKSFWFILFSKNIMDSLVLAVERIFFCDSKIEKFYLFDHYLINKFTLTLKYLKLAFTWFVNQKMKWLFELLRK